MAHKNVEDRCYIACLRSGCPKDQLKAMWEKNSPVGSGLGPSSLESLATQPVSEKPLNSTSAELSPATSLQRCPARKRPRRVATVDLSGHECIQSLLKAIQANVLWQ